MGAWGIGHWVVVAVIVMLLFGRGKVSELMGDVAKGIKAFKKGMSEEDENPKPQQVNTSEPVRTLPHQANEPAPMAGVHAPADRKVI